MLFKYIKKRWILVISFLLAFIALSTFMLKDQLTEKNYFKKYIKKKLYTEGTHIIVDTFYYTIKKFFNKKN